MAKNKMKSHRGAMKRLHVTGSGKVKRNKASRATFSQRRPQREKEVCVRQLLLQVQI